MFWLLPFRQFNASLTENGIIETLEKQQNKELHWSSIFYYKRYKIRISLCTGKGAPYLLLFDDADHHFNVVLFFTFLLKSLGVFCCFFCYSCVSFTWCFNWLELVTEIREAFGLYWRIKCPDFTQQNFYSSNNKKKNHSFDLIHSFQLDRGQYEGKKIFILTLNIYKSWKRVCCMGERHTFMTRKKSLMSSTENYSMAKVCLAENKSPHNHLCYEFTGPLYAHATTGCKHSNKTNTSHLYPELQQHWRKQLTEGWLRGCWVNWELANVPCCWFHL